jgi:hypothetical protein
VGGRLKLQALPGATLVVANPRGEVTSGGMDTGTTLTMGLPGEWLLQIEDAQGIAVVFPIYVGIVPPEAPVIEHGPAPTNSDDLSAAFQTLFDSVRGAYGAEPLESDLLIGSAARAMMAQRTGSAAEVARHLGYAVDSTWRIECQARTVESCIDQMLWNPKARPAMLVDHGHLGVSAELTSSGVHVIALIARH